MCLGGGGGGGVIVGVGCCWSSGQGGEMVAPSIFDLFWEIMNNCFDVKIVHHNNAVIKFLLQNENGPCPLIALINLLSLQGQLRLRAQSNSSSDAATATIVTTEWLLNALQDVLFEQQQNVQTVDQQDVVKVMTLLPTLISGLNTSLKFNGPVSK